MKHFHTPVMLPEVTHGLNIRPGKKYIDATVGGGGHGVEIVKRGGILLGIDQDPEAVEFTKENLKSQILNLKEYKDWKIVQGNFRDIETIAKENGFGEVDGILFDLGVSSHQLDTPGRGFSYRFTGAPLDLRMNQNKGVTAAQLVNRASKEDLYDIFTRFAEEELAWPITRAIFSARAVKPIETTGELARIVGGVVKNRRDKNRTLSRVFQALRIAANDELGALRQGLQGSQGLLETGGRLVVITFHSLEDRMVKQFMREKEWKLITKKPITPTRGEVVANPRSRSAKLRITEKL